MVVAIVVEGTVEQRGDLFQEVAPGSPPRRLSSTKRLLISTLPAAVSPVSRTHLLTDLHEVFSLTDLHEEVFSLHCNTSFLY